MKEVMGLRFIPNGTIFYYEKGNQSYQLNEKLIVQHGENEEIAKVVIYSKKCHEQDAAYASDNIIRKAEDADLIKEEKNKIEAAQALRIAKERARENKLEMKIIKAQYSFDRQKLTFLFSAAGRVDFRVLVRELASIFRTRIELRQIGARDEAKILGGIGPCGRPLCCSTFLGDFMPVSIKMAKDQGLSLNSAKISGICGRLMCCLNFENEAYEELKRSLPDYGEKIDTPEGQGKVIGLNILSQIVTVRFFKDNKTADYTWEELKGELV
ncbi:PSP1 domain-containing protein [Jeotgalibaca ciconiae]|uniref:Signal peptidase n=1 Tax=Jeotgalibaca ciconiae TaxID=2496265 RepID=A0A3Q9BJY7_9LACT|nr:stage 0 sporulation family protein [Jeotgalibaca ciconiae]AZP04150.1 signal peptidase [Jeotgalibaca ciconiae]HJB22781.1 stage 0 sporulation family protein [Candidatus Jeotgalibaca pullicola]